MSNDNDSPSDNEKVIQFPGQVGSKSDGHDAQSASGEGVVSPPGNGELGIPGLTQDQEKAMQIAMDGMSFVVVGIKPTDSGADFFTAVHGDREDLRNAGPHLDGVIQRAFERYDIY